MKTKFFSAVLAAMMFAIASVGVTASAAEITETAVSAAEESTADDDTDSSESVPSAEISAVSEDSGIDVDEFKDIMSELAGQGTGTITVEPDYYSDGYYDTDGNAALIKSESIIYNTEEMQFIAVTTKDGHVFYVLINYSSASGEDSVYFLNKVDDYDLYALLYAGDDSDESSITPEQAAQAAEEANGRVKPKSDSDTADTIDTAENGEDTSEGNEEQTAAVPMNMNSIYLVFGVIALIGVGAAGFILTKKKSKSKSVSADEPDDEEEEICIKEDEEDFNFYDDNQDE